MDKNNCKGGGKFIKESNKKLGSYTIKYEKKEDNIEERLYLLKKNLKREYDSIDFINDKYAGVKLEAVYNEIIGKEIEKAKKEKKLKTEKRVKEAKEYLKTLKERYPEQYENYNVQIKNKLKAKIRKSKSFFRKQFSL